MGHVQFTLRSGHALDHVPAHLDCLAGSGRPAGRFDNGALDRVFSRHGGGGARASCVFHARRGFGRPGAQHVGFDDREEALGLSRTYRAQIADPAHSDDVVNALRDLAQVESACVQTFALAPWAESMAATVAGEEALKHSNLPHEQIRVPQAHALERGDERVTVAIVDTGVVIGHPEFQRKCLAGYDTVDIGMGHVGDKLTLVGDSRGHDYNPYDDVGHGCHVAGIIGAQGWRIPRGVAGRALVLPLRVLAAAIQAGGARPLGVGALPDIDAGMKVAIDLGAAVINMSFGTSESQVDPDGPLPHLAVVRYAMSAGCTLVAAAGNSGQREKYYPAALPEVICVAAVDAQDRRASFSTTGDHVCVSAPGVGIVSVGRRGYQVNSGTSFAAPFVAGVAALVLARARRLGHEMNGLKVKALLQATARRIGAAFSEETGHGVVDALAAVQRAGLQGETR
ncbi:MAG: S8 family serine peptidase [Burkholderiales bacterium]